MEPTRANRLLKTLTAAGIASQGPDQRYASGPGMHVLSAMSLHASNLIPVARPALEELGTLGQTVALGVLWREKVAYLYHWKPGLSFSDAIGRVGLFDATRSSIGIALLAALPCTEVDARYPADASIPGFASRTALNDALHAARASGIAVISAEGARTTRAAVIHSHGAIPYAAVAVSGSIAPKEEAAVSQAVIRAAERIGRKMGG